MTDFITTLNELPEEKLKGLIEATKGTDARDELRKLALASYASQNDTSEGFLAAFELWAGFKIRPYGEEWVRKAYEAHEQNLGLLQKVHREGAKTTIFSFYFALFQLGHRPHTTSGIIRINDTKAKMTAAAIANFIETSDRWAAVFPHIIPDDKSAWGEDKGYHLIDSSMSRSDWEKSCEGRPLGPTFIGYGYDSGSVIGSRWNGFIIVDDIHDLKNTRSQVEMRGVVDWYKAVYNQCVRPECREVWNYTPWRTADVYAYAENTGSFMVNKTPVFWPVEEGDDGAVWWPPDPLVPISGQWVRLSWPSEFPVERLSRKFRDSGPIEFARMFQLDLKATEGVNLKDEWLLPYPAEAVDWNWPIFFGVDYAGTSDRQTRKETDYFALSYLIAPPTGGLVLFGGVRARQAKGDSLKAVASAAGRYRSLVLAGVEALGVGGEFYDDLTAIYDVTDRTIPLTPITHPKGWDKGYRFEKWMAPNFQFGRVKIIDEAPDEMSERFIQSFRDEWLTWPNAQFDDVLDSVYMGMKAGEKALHSVATSGRVGNSELDQIQEGKKGARNRKDMFTNIRF